MNNKRLNYFLIIFVSFSFLFLLTSCVQQTTAHTTDDTYYESEENIDLQKPSDIISEEQIKQDEENEQLELKKVTDQVQVVIPQKDIIKIKEVIMADDFPELLLVSKSHPLEYENYPNFIVPNTIPSTREVNVNDKVLTELERLHTDITEDQITDLLVVSGYRDVAYQEMLFQREMNKYINDHSQEESFNLASQAVAIPGTSEHHTGLAVDFLSSTQYSLTASFEITPSGSWLFENAYKYGFILRYPKDKTELTGIMFEPWHYRYVGKPHSEYIMKQNICFEEYITKLQTEKNIQYLSEDGITYNITYIDDIETFDFNNSVINEDNIFETTHMGASTYIVTTTE